MPDVRSRERGRGLASSITPTACACRAISASICEIAEASPRARASGSAVASRRSAASGVPLSPYPVARATASTASSAASASLNCASQGVTCSPGSASSRRSARPRSAAIAGRSEKLPASANAFRHEPASAETLNRLAGKGPHGVGSRLTGIRVAQRPCDRRRWHAVHPTERCEVIRDVSRVGAEQGQHGGGISVDEQTGPQYGCAEVGGNLPKLARDLTADRRVQFLDALRCGMQAAAQRRAERQGNAWVTPHQFRKAVFVEAKQLAIAVGQHSRRPWLASEERHIPKTCATPNVATRT